MFAPDLPKPILFHPLKHHLQYNRCFLREHILTDEASLIASLRTIGSSQLDFYTGPLSPQQIAEEVILYLQMQGMLQPALYRQYLAASGSHYRTTTLSDGTDWVLRWGIVAERHVHLHPARYAAHTRRVKANTLKTALAVLLAAKRQEQPALTLQLVNQVRLQWLGLPPVKSIEDGDGLVKLLQYLEQPENGSATGWGGAAAL